MAALINLSRTPRKGRAVTQHLGPCYMTKGTGEILQRGILRTSHGKKQSRRQSLSCNSFMLNFTQNRHSSSSVSSTPEKVLQPFLQEPPQQSPNGLAVTLPSPCPVCISVPFKYLLLSTVHQLYSAPVCSPLVGVPHSSWCVPCPTFLMSPWEVWMGHFLLPWFQLSWSQPCVFMLICHDTRGGFGRPWRSGALDGH